MCIFVLKYSFKFHLFFVFVLFFGNTLFYDCDIVLTQSGYKFTANLFMLNNLTVHINMKPDMYLASHKKINTASIQKLYSQGNIAYEALIGRPPGTRVVQNGKSHSTFLDSVFRYLEVLAILCKWGTSKKRTIKMGQVL